MTRAGRDAEVLQVAAEARLRGQDPPLHQSPTNAGKLGALARFVAAMAANAADLIHLEGPRLRVETILTEAQGVARARSTWHFRPALPALTA